MLYLSPERDSKLKKGLIKITLIVGLTILILVKEIRNLPVNEDIKFQKLYKVIEKAPYNIEKFQELDKVIEKAPYNIEDYKAGEFDCSNMAALLCDWLEKQGYNANIVSTSMHAWVEVSGVYIEPTTKKRLLFFKKIFYDRKFQPQEIYDNSTDAKRAVRELFDPNKTTISRLFISYSNATLEVTDYSGVFVSKNEPIEVTPIEGGVRIEYLAINAPPPEKVSDEDPDLRAQRIFIKEIYFVSVRLGMEGEIYEYLFPSEIQKYTGMTLKEAIQEKIKTRNKNEIEKLIERLWGYEPYLKGEK